MNYQTSFQCPETGYTVIARYAFGRVTIEPTDETDNVTIVYCARYTGKKIKSLEAANDYIVKVSDGQTFGFERA